MVWLLEMAEWLVQMPHVYQEVLDLVNSYQAAIVGDCCLLSAVPILHEKQIKGNFYNIGAGERERGIAYQQLEILNHWWLEALQKN